MINTNSMYLEGYSDKEILLLKEKISRLNSQKNSLELSLNEVRSAKAYRMWQRYDVLKKKLKHYLSKIF